MFMEESARVGRHRRAWLVSHLYAMELLRMAVVARYLVSLDAAAVAAKTPFEVLLVCALELPVLLGMLWLISHRVRQLGALFRPPEKVPRAQARRRLRRPERRLQP